MIDKQTEESIVKSVIEALLQESSLKSGGGAATAPSSAAPSPVSDGAPVELSPVDDIGLEDAHNMEAIKVMRKTTPARVLLGRAGTRPRTQAYLNFLADHAAALDAVFEEVSDEFLEANNLFKVKTTAADKDEYLMKPELGKKFSDEARKAIAEKCEKGKQVQIIVVDGLSSTAIEANVADVVPALAQGLKAEGISVGTPFYIQYGRVAIQDDLSSAIDFDVVVCLIGERPGLVTANSMSAYITYKAGPDTVEADRTVISNIHSGGTPPAEAGAHIATIVKQALTHKVTGLKLSDLVG